MPGQGMMQNADATDSMQSNSEQDLSEGYCIQVCVYKNGFTVSDPEPLPESDTGEDAESSSSSESDEDRIPDLATALKHVMKVVKDNPVTGGEQDAFDSVDSDSGSKGKY